MTTPNWTHWADQDMEFWTPEQAICLSLDIDPDQPVPQSLRALHAERLRVLLGAIQLQLDRPQDFNNRADKLTVIGGRVDRSSFVFWASQRKGWLSRESALHKMETGEPVPQRSELTSALRSSHGQSILPAGMRAHASRGEIVLPVDVDRVTVNAAIELTLSAAAIQFPDYVNVYERESIDSDDADEVKFERVNGRTEAERLAWRDFPAACRALGIRLRNPYSPHADDYTGTPEQNVYYQMSVDELRAYARPYGVTVRIEGAPPAGTQDIARALSDEKDGNSTYLTLDAARSGMATVLKIGPNRKDVMNSCIETRAREMYVGNSSLGKGDIAKAIAEEFKAAGYSGERGNYLSVATIEKAIPTGLTGGRQANGKNRKR